MTIKLFVTCVNTVKRDQKALVIAWAYAGFAKGEQLLGGLGRLRGVATRLLGGPRLASLFFYTGIKQWNALPSTIYSITIVSKLLNLKLKNYYG